MNFTNEPVFECYCKSQMVLKTKKENKGFYVGCRGYPDCRNSIWLPNSIIEAQVANEYCDRCKPKRVKKLKFKFERGSVPQHIPLEYITCIICDEELRECLQIQIKTNAVSNDNNNRFPIPTSTNITTSNRNQVPTLRPAPTPQPLQTIRNRSLNDSNENDENPIYCHCSSLAALKSVRKEGPNQGRQFYSCGQNSCNFFAWKDAIDANQINQPTFSQPSNMGRQNMNNNTSVSRNDNRGSIDGGGVNCNCGKPAVM